MSKIYQELFTEDSPNIIETRKIVEFIEKGVNCPDGKERTQVGCSLIEVKASRRLKESLDNNTQKLIKALNRNSDSSDKLARVGNFIGWIGVIATVTGALFGILSFFCK